MTADVGRNPGQLIFIDVVVFPDAIFEVMLPVQRTAKKAMAGNIPTMALFISAPKPPAKPSLSHKPGSVAPSAVSVFYCFLSRMRLRIRWQSAILNPGYNIFC